MAWLKKFFTKTKVGKSLGTGLDYLTAGFVHPIQTFKAGVSKKKTIRQHVIKPHFAQPLSKQITQTLTSTVGYATLVAGGAAAGAFGTAAKAGKVATLARGAAVGAGRSVGGFAKAHPIKTLVGAPIITGILVKSPSTRKAATTFLSPSANIERGIKAGKIIEGGMTPTSKIGKAAKAAGLIGAGAAALVVAPKIISKLRDKVKVKAAGQPEVVFTPAAAEMPKHTTPLQDTPGEIKPQKPVATEKAVSPIKVSQKVNVSVRNSKRYINAIAVSN